MMTLDQTKNLLVGGGALAQMLQCIGDTEKTDHDIAKLLVDNEKELSELMKFAMSQLKETTSR